MLTSEIIQTEFQSNLTFFMARENERLMELTLDGKCHRCEKKKPGVGKILIHPRTKEERIATCCDDCRKILGKEFMAKIEKWKKTKQEDQ